jgi:hypothetical protein
MTRPRRASQRAIKPEPGTTFVGIDVGEDFLDLAILRSKVLRAYRLDYQRIDLRDLNHRPIDALARKIQSVLPRDRCLALVDSPRSPRDLDLTNLRGFDGPASPVGRALDRSLREFVRARCGTSLRFALFPTPILAYYDACMGRPDAKSHLRAVHRALFGLDRSTRSEALDAGRGKPGGGTFTRFMLCGFATYRALEALGFESYECFPDLVFKIWSGGRKVPPKSNRRAAYFARIQINRALGAALKISAGHAGASLDQADAGVMAAAAAVAAHSGTLTVFECPAEGAFLLPLPERLPGAPKAAAPS